MTDQLNATLAEIGDLVGEMKSDVEAARKLADRVGELEVALDRRQGGGAGGARVGTQEQKEHLAMFERHLRRPHDMGLKQELQGMETKVASGLTDTAGGALVPELLVGPIMNRVKDTSAMRQVSRKIQVTSGDVKIPVSENNASSEWVGETDTRNATTEPTVLERKPTFGTVSAYVSASEELLYDSAFSIRDWFVQSIGDQFAAAEGAAFITGNGTNKPTGILNTAPESAADGDSPARTDKALQYLPTGAAGAFVDLSTSSPVSYPDSVLVDALFALKADYRANAVWMMNSATAATVRKFRDADGRMLWSDGLMEGQPDRLLGRPVIIEEQLPQIAANSHSILVGDFERGYIVADAGGLRVTLDDNVTTPGRVKWYVRKRVGGIVGDCHAVKAIKFAAT